MVDVVFLGFVVNLCGSPWIIDLNLCGSPWVIDFGFYGCCCFSGFCGESMWVSVGFSRFSASASVCVCVFFFQWWWMGYVFAGWRRVSVSLLG